MTEKFQHNKALTSYSRNNRKQQTEAEKLLWFHLRKRQLAGLKFHRQYPIDSYILDFYCFEKMLAIELDGSQHITNKEHDLARTKHLHTRGIKVVRYWDNDVLKDIESVLEDLMRHVA